MYEPTEAQIADGIEHALYEIDMLVFTASQVGASPLGSDPRLDHALVESFVLHARLLVDFFWGYRKADTPPDDIFAEDFVRDPSTWESERGALPRVLADFRVRANKEVAHLTRTRRRGQDVPESWDVKGVVDEFRPAMELFAKHIEQAAAVVGATKSSYPLFLSPAPGATGATQPAGTIIDMMKKS